MVTGSNLFLVINSHPYYQNLVDFLGENTVLLLVYSFGIFIYSIFIWHFYKKLSKRDLFELDLSKYQFDSGAWVGFKKFFSVILYLLKYCVLFPFYIFFWFGVTTLFFFLIAKNVDVMNILLISMSLIVTIRMATYYKEELANDIAKLIPFALLAMVLTDPNFFSVQRFFERIYEIPTLLNNFTEFFIFVFAIEGTFRLLYLIFSKKESIIYEEAKENQEKPNRHSI